MKRKDIDFKQWLEHKLEMQEWLGEEYPNETAGTDN